MGELPPGPHLDAHSWERLNRRPLGELDRYRERFGDVFTVHAPNRPPRVYVGSPELIRTLLVDHDERLPAVGAEFVRPLVGDQAVIYLRGREHRAARRLMSPLLHGTSLPSYAAAIVDTTVTVARERLGPTPAPLLPVAREISLRVMCAVIFGAQPAHRRDRIVELVGGLMEELREPSGVSLAERLDAGCRDLEGVIAEESARPAGPQEPPTILRHMHQAAAAAGRPLSPRVARGHVASLLIAGFDTTAAAVVWAAALLEAHPAVHRTLLRDIRAVPPGPGVADRLSWIPYLLAVCDEVLRYGSITPTGAARRTTATLDVGGYSIPPGTELVPCFHLANRDPVEFPSPELFDPARFLDRSGRTARFHPFGVGPHRCLGAGLARYELPVALATLLTIPGYRTRIPDAGLTAVAFDPAVVVPDGVHAVVERVEE